MLLAIATLALVSASASASALPATDPPALASPQLQVTFHGNVVLPEEVYVAILNLPDDAPATEATAATVRERLMRFLHRAGYELAVVATARRQDELHVFIDEGQLGKIILRGQGAWGTLQAHLALELPQKVFNRPAVERLIGRLSTRYGVQVERYELVPSSEVEHIGPQLTTLGPVDGVMQSFFGRPLIPPQSRNDLVLVSNRDEFARGLGFGADLSGADGLVGSAEFRGRGLLWKSDRWLARAQAGAKVRNRLLTDGAYLAPTRGALELRWLSPPLGWTLRPGLEVGAEYSSRQRPDLPLESYRLTRLRASASLRAELHAGLELSLGAGLERLDAFHLEAAAGAPVPGGVRPIGLTHPVLSAGLDVDVSPQELRRDRHHELHLEALLYPTSAIESYEVARWKYQKVFELGWHDLWVTSRGAFWWGEPPFVEETSVGGSLVRGVFPDRLFSRRAGSLSLEARLSVVRDVYKLAVFHDLALFQERDPLTGAVRPRLANAFGLGFSALVTDTFQLGVYYALGFSGASLGRGGGFDRGLSVNLSEAF